MYNVVHSRAGLILRIVLFDTNIFYMISSWNIYLVLNYCYLVLLFKNSVLEPLDLIQTLQFWPKLAKNPKTHLFQTIHPISFLYTPKFSAHLVLLKKQI